MPCRVGITTNPTERKDYWDRKVVGLKKWKCDFVGSKSEAQREENRRQEFCNNYQNRGCCHAHHGGGDPYNTRWYVYEFDYDRTK